MKHRDGQRGSTRTASEDRASAPGAAAWHLAGSANEQALTRVEFGMERLIHAYYRWKVSCLSAVGDYPLAGDDISILNIIRMGDEPKKLADVARLLNRADMSNLQYATRKLINAGLVEKLNASSRKDTAYRATPKGIEVTDRYAATRRELVTARLEEIVGPASLLQDTSAVFDQLVEIYEQGVRRAAARGSGLVERRD